MYKYLLWDIDGTVLNFLASEAYAIRTLFKKYNLGTCTDDMIKLYSDINVKYWKMLERGELTKPQILVERFKEFFDIIGVEDVSIAESFNSDYQVTLGDHIEFVDKAERILLSHNGKFTLAAVTNGTKTAQEKKLRLSGLYKVFDAIFISENIGFEKPDKKFFDCVFENLGIKDKKEVLIIGDSLTSDIKGGFDSGNDTCWFNPTKSPNTFGIDVTYEIDDLGEIEDIIF